MLQISHEEVHRFLCNSSFSGKDLFDKGSAAIELPRGGLSLDEVVIDKPFRAPQSSVLRGFAKNLVFGIALFEAMILIN